MEFDEGEKETRNTSCSYRKRGKIERKYTYARVRAD